MKKFTTFTGLTVPIDRPNVDTDAIIPKQYLKSIQRTGFGPNLFDEWRYLDHGEPGMDHSKRPINPDFELNQERYQGAQILLGRDNFGCGSSREHAVWALDNYGIRVVIAPSFADIFFNNTFKNGLLSIVLDAAIIDRLFEQSEAQPGYALDVSLEEKTITISDGEKIAFEVEDYRRHRLMEGLDDIGITLQHAGDIKAFEDKRKADAPWLF